MVPLVKTDQPGSNILLNVMFLSMEKFSRILFSASWFKHRTDPNTLLYMIKAYAEHAAAYTNTSMHYVVQLQSMLAIKL